MSVVVFLLKYYTSLVSSSNCEKWEQVKDAFKKILITSIIVR